MAVLKFLFILSVFTVCLGQLARVDLRNGIAFTVTDISVGILFLFWMGRVIVGKKIHTFFDDKIIKAIFYFSIICVISLFINAHRFSLFQLGVSSLYLLRFIAYTSLYAITASFDNNFKRKIPLLLVLSGLFIVGSGYIQYVYYNSLQNLFYLGWDNHMYRVFSVFLDPNFVGAFFVLLVLETITLFIGIKQSLFKKISIITVIIFSIASIFLTHSRSTIIMLIVSSIILFTLLQKRRYIIITFLLVIIVIIGFSSQFYIENINFFRTISSKARIETTNNALITIYNNPILGVGFNTYRYYQIQQGFRNGLSAVYSHADAGTDSSFLFVLATTGVVGGVAYAYLWKTIFQRCFLAVRSKAKEVKIKGIITIASIVGIFSHALFVNSLFYPFLMLWIWILVGLLPAKNFMENK